MPRSYWKRTFRSITVDGKEIEFSGGFTDLHNLSYQEILKGNGFGLEETKKSIETVYKIRNATPIGLKGEGLVFDYTKVALKRIGFEVLCNKEYDTFVTIINSNDTFEWIFEKENTKFVFKSIYELIKNINHYFILTKL